jgi:tetratricopeptide (TPR) repeat protein
MIWNYIKILCIIFFINNLILLLDAPPNTYMQIKDEYNTTDFSPYDYLEDYINNRFTNGIFFTDTNTPSDFYVFIGKYYLLKNINHGLALLKRADKYNNTNSYYELANYYKFRNTDKFLHYSFKGINYNHTGCMVLIGNYYSNLENYNTMKYYYLMAINIDNNLMAIFNLAAHYENIENNSHSYLYYYKLFKSLFNKKTHYYYIDYYYYVLFILN